MRDIKFRAWDGESMEYDIAVGQHSKDRKGAPSVTVILDDGDCRYPEEPFVAVMQFTGLKDRHGVEIYEGDIIIKNFSDRPYSSSKKFKNGIMVVEYYIHKPSDNEFNNKNLDKDPSYYNSQPHFYGKRIDKYKYDYSCCNWSEFAGCEIIGNIYENPDLTVVHK